MSLPPYQLRYSSKRRTLQLQIKAGQLRVAAPVGLSLRQIEDFIREKAGWIERHLSVPEPLVPDWLTQQQLPYLGQQLQLKIVTDTLNAWTLEGDTLWLQLSSRNKAENQRRWMQQLVQQFYANEAELWFGHSAARFANAMGVQYQRISSGDFKRKWGSCSSKGDLQFNWRLMMAPEWICTYVLVHELAHLRHMNHSADFWQLVSQFNADAKPARAWLRQNQHWMQLD